MTQNLLANGLLQQLGLLERDVLSLANALPASAYTFTPTQGMRTFGEQLKHLATVVYLTAGTMKQTQSRYAPGERNNGPSEIESKEAILKYVTEAFAEVRGILSTLSDATSLERIPSYFGPKTRADLGSGLLQHSYNHYGQLVVYTRLLGVAPPSSIPA